MKLRPATFTNQHHLRLCGEGLRAARHHARLADCPSLLKKINRAIAAHGGAERHMQRRVDHSNPNE